MAYRNLLVDIAGGIATVTVNRPDTLNALNALTIDELSSCFDSLYHDAAARVVIVSGAGDRAFVAGADIKELANMSGPQAQQLACRGQALMTKIEQLGKPVIAAVNGFALGGGCELALACHFRYAAENARLGLPETGLGLIPGYGGTQRLPRLVGKGRAAELILTGTHLTAAQALAMGLVNMVLPQEELLSETREAATAIASKSAVSIGLALQAIVEGLEMPLGEGCRHEAALFGVCGGTRDATEGCTAFLEKRKPDFEDR